MADHESSWAWRLARSELELPLPRRWAHSQGVGRAAIEVAARLDCDTELLVASAILHDVGYAPRLVVTGFHPLDGARFLRDEHEADQRVTRLVANHTFALLEADERELGVQLAAEFPILDDHVLVDALTYCDMTTTPDGEPTTAANRIHEILTRYGRDTTVGRFMQCAATNILEAVFRTEEAMGAHPR
ncbi:HD domain-containing protein [Nocardia seriolae]|uniref:HD domain-containing protein n=2 Tax=Nocardia seriolae TaxID=37332 RepID=UPI0008F4C2AC|nr:HD domain-containing protein [Nocardia seriolae]OJF84987.1 phosphohydrolase [Nocardia seriolae]QUN19757.1 HD domain-containing protein [Nocardia seriolae]WNJ59233.1 HD domain-containing protein [Nocardia seriolae]